MRKHINTTQSYFADKDVRADIIHLCAAVLLVFLWQLTLTTFIASIPGFT